MLHTKVNRRNSAREAVVTRGNDHNRMLLGRDGDYGNFKKILVNFNCCRCETLTIKACDIKLKVAIHDQISLNYNDWMYISFCSNFIDSILPAFLQPNVRLRAHSTRYYRIQKTFIYSLKVNVLCYFLFLST